MESQKTASKTFEESLDTSAMLVKTQQGGKAMSNKAGFKKKEKEEILCDHYKAQGHLKDNYFKLIGYPEWYVDLVKTKKDKKQPKSVNMTEIDQERPKLGSDKQQEWMVDVIKQEITKALKGAKSGRDDDSR